MVDKVVYERAKKKVEEDLRNYPYWIISERLPGLGQAVNWNITSGKSTRVFNTSTVENTVINNDLILTKIKIIEAVFDRLDKNSQTIIERWYFRDDESSREDLLTELNIDKNKYYYYKNRSLRKFMVALRYI